MEDQNALIVKTMFDILNAKAALYAVGEYLETARLDIPVFVSGWIIVYVHCLVILDRCFMHLSGVRNR